MPMLEPVEIVTSPAARDYRALGVFTTRLSWGVKDMAGEWIRKCITKGQALKTFNEDAEAFQLYDGCDPWACLDDSTENFVLRKEKTNVPAPEGVPGTSAG